MTRALVDQLEHRVNKDRRVSRDCRVIPEALDYVAELELQEAPVKLVCSEQQAVLVSLALLVPQDLRDRKVRQD